MRHLVGDLRQLASVRRIMLDDGPERGVRALAFSTGGGLDFWVLSDRSLDIGPLWCDGRPVAWQGAPGFRNPGLHDAEGDEGRGFNRSFSGFLVTCGLDHVRQPDGPYPLHGRLPFTPGRLLAYGEDWERDDPTLFCEGEVVQARYGGEHLVLRRRIEAPIGGRSLRIADRVENQAAHPSRHAMLYHINVGYPALSRGSVLRFGDKLLAGPIGMPDEGEESRSFSVPVEEGPGPCRLETPTARDVFAMTVSQTAGTLPHLQIWHDLRPNAFVLGIEPCTGARGPDGRSLEEPTLSPGERRRYGLNVTFDGTPPPIGEDEWAKKRADRTVPAGTTG
jgi:hypothetical protein